MKFSFSPRAGPGAGQPVAALPDPPDAPLRNVSILTTGPAAGHGVWADRALVQQLVVAGNAAPHGIKARFGHPAFGADPVGSELGVFRQFRLRFAGPGPEPALDTWQAVADLHWQPTPLNAPAIAHLLSLARAAPHLVGASVEFTPAPAAPPENPLGYPHERLAQLLAIALTSDPACNPGGLLAR